ncbi:MAG: Rieske 2Fe-2S domain-containing protein [Novosphingobium sp.]
MVTASENARLTRVEGDAPMGQMLRNNFWLPFARSEALVPGGAPQRVRLLGTDMVAFRGDDGTLGLMDEYCPHRRASMALARVEGCSLRCIYHGWRLGADGAVVEVPSEGERSGEFAARIKTNRYSIREGGGLVWAFLGHGEAPDLPPLPFMQVPPEGRAWWKMTVRCNWLQGFEGALDSVHLNWLHQGWSDPAMKGQFLSGPPAYEIGETAYGLRTAAIRQPGPGRVHLRVAEYVAPFFAFSASRQPTIPTDCSCFISVPVDDETHILLFGVWDEAGAVQSMERFFEGLDPDDLLAGDFHRGNNWGQDREAMASNHFSGFTRSVLHEDLGVQMSMGPIVAREDEQLCGTDLAIVRMRQFLLDMMGKHDSGGEVDRNFRGYRDEGSLPFSYEAAEGADWRLGGQRGRLGEPVTAAA